MTIPEDVTFADVEIILKNWKQSLDREKKKRQEEVQTLERLRLRLQGIDGEKTTLRSAAETAEQKQMETRTVLISCRAEQNSLETSREYKTEAEATAVLAKAGGRKKAGRAEPQRCRGCRPEGKVRSGECPDPDPPLPG